MAAVAKTGLVEDPNKADDWTLIDGLQRTTCYIIAVLMAALGEELVEEGCLEEAIWNETFKEHADECDVAKLLERQQRLEAEKERVKAAQSEQFACVDPLVKAVIQWGFNSPEHEL